jgi:hypothetical protein
MQNFTFSEVPKYFYYFSLLLMFFKLEKGLDIGKRIVGTSPCTGPALR